MFFSLVYCFVYRIMTSMLKHLASMFLEFWFLCVLVKMCQIPYYAFWIDSIYTELTHQSFWLLMNRFATSWIDSRLNRLISIWIVSPNSLAFTESIHHKVESYQSSSWAHLNRFSYTLSFFIQICVVFCCLNPFTHLVNRFTVLFLCENLVLSPLSINCSYLTTPKVLNHLQLFSLGLKNSKFIHSLRLTLFLRITLFFESIDLLGC
jgi:hypothetical protein